MLKIFTKAKGPKLVAALAALVFVYTPATAANFELKDGTVLQGDLVHYYQGLFHIALKDGSSVKLAAEKVKTLHMGELPKKEVTTSEKQLEPEAAAEPAKKKAKKSKKGAFRTPKSTFEHWRKALLRGDLQAMADSFIDAAAPLMLQKLESIPQDQRKKMIADTKKTRFKLGRAKIDGDRATMEVTRRYKKQRASTTHSFILEEGEWKLVPN